MRNLFAAFGGFLLLASPSAAEVFTPADWERVDAVISSMTRDRYQHGELIVRKSFKRIYFTSVKTQNTFVWLFDANLRKAYMGNSNNGLYWEMKDVDKYVEQEPGVPLDILRKQLDSIEIIVAIINGTYIP